MDDLASKISQVLSDPESVKQLSELASMLGFSPDGSPSQNTGGSGGSAFGSPSESKQQQGGGSPMPDLSAMMAIASKLRESGGSDNNINFLIALRPLLGEEKQKRIDRAVQLLRIINLLPILKESGILGGDIFAGL